MALKQRLVDASYWLYDRSRHKTAFEAAARPGTAPDFFGFENHKAGDVEGDVGDGTSGFATGVTFDGGLEAPALWPRTRL
jgi:hypothetical protein